MRSRVMIKFKILTLHLVTRSVEFPCHLPARRRDLRDQMTAWRGVRGPQLRSMLLRIVAAWGVPSQTQILRGTRSKVCSCGRRGSVRLRRRTSRRRTEDVKRRRHSRFVRIEAKFFNDFGRNLVTHSLPGSKSASLCMSVRARGDMREVS